MDAQTIAELFERELARFKNQRAAQALRKLAVPVRVEERPWSYGEPGQRFPCWIVADDPDSWTCFCYCEFGFGPQSPWGLLNMLDSGPGALTSSMGMDSGWFRTLEDAFLESYPGDEFRSSIGARERFYAQKGLAELMRQNGHSKTAAKFEMMTEANSLSKTCELLKELNEDAQDFQRRSAERFAKMREWKIGALDELDEVRRNL
jgi:hypothetical protein